MCIESVVKLETVKIVRLDVRAQHCFLTTNPIIITKALVYI